MLTASEQRLLDAIRRDETTRLVRELVRRPSENPPGREAAVAEYLADACRELGLRVEIEEVAPGRPNVYVSVGPSGRDGLLLLGHTDVVPAGSGWTHPPFGAVVDEGRIVGRGAADMKGGIAASVIAMAALARSGLALRAGVTLAAVVDEEESGLGVKALLRRPSFGARGAIVPEPTGLQTIVACRGNCYVQIDVEGRSAHAGSPERGANAIYGAARVVDAVRALHEEVAGDRHPRLGAGGYSVGLIDGGSGTAMVPEHCRVSVDCRLLPEQSAQDARARIDAAIAALDLASDGLRARTAVLMEIPSFEVAPEHALVRAAVGATGDAGGREQPVGGWTAACDGGYLMRHAGIPAVVLGPGSVERDAHRPDESVRIDDVLIAARVYALCAARTLGPETA